MPQEYTMKNAVIRSTSLGVAHTDLGILSFYINLDYGGSGQGFGGLVLDDKPNEGSRDRKPSLLASSLLLGIDKVFGVDLEKLPGISCRAYGHHSNVRALGHFLEDKWLWYNTANNEFEVTPFSQCGS